MYLPMKAYYIHLYHQLEKRVNTWNGTKLMLQIEDKLRNPPLALKQEYRIYLTFVERANETLKTGIDSSGIGFTIPDGN